MSASKTALTESQAILEAALALPLEERLRITNRLLENLEAAGDDIWHQMDPEIRRAWETEVERRWQEVLDGKATLIPADEVFSRIRERLAK